MRRIVLSDVSNEEMVMDVGGCDGDWCLGLQHQRRSSKSSKLRSLRKRTNAKHWIVVEKDMNSVLRGLIIGGLAQGVVALNYLKKDA